MSRHFTIIDAPQRSEQWFTARLGCATASRAGDVVASIKTGEAAARRDYRVQLVCERLTGTMQEDGFVSADMQRGTDLEPAAFSAYEAVTGNLASRVGFLRSTEHMAGASPDGVIGDFEGLIELKCPKSATHLKYLRAGTVPSDYLPQMLHQLWISGAPWVDFVSYDPRWPSDLQLFVVRLERNETAIQNYAAQVLAFLGEVEREVEAVRTMRNVGAVLKKTVV